MGFTRWLYSRWTQTAKNSSHVFHHYGGCNAILPHHHGIIISDIPLFSGYTFVGFCGQARPIQGRLESRTSEICQRITVTSWFELFSSILPLRFEPDRVQDKRGRANGAKTYKGTCRRVHCPTHPGLFTEGVRKDLLGTTWGGFARHGIDTYLVTMR